MSKSPKKPVLKKRLRIDRPFDPAVLKRAYQLAARYRLILDPDAGTGFIGRAVEAPHWLGVGRTPDECVHETREVIASALATMIELGEVPPSPASQQLREEQINIRVTAEERLFLEEAARAKGFRGISDFVRTTTLARLG